MARGFAKKQTLSDISVDSMVSANSGLPMVKLEWGKESGLLTPEEARAHALGIFEAAASAQIDAVVVKWANQELGMDLAQSAHLRRLFRERRETGQMPSCTLNFDGDRLTPDEVRRCALDMLFMAFNTEMEAFLGQFLIDEVGSDEAQVNVVIEALRKMQGLQRIDELDDEGSDRHANH